MNDRSINHNITDEIGWTSLHNAASKGDLDKLVLLLNGGAQIDAVDKNGDIPLHVAARNGHFNILKHLVDSDGGAHINTAEKFGGYTPLHFASEKGYLDIAEFLVHRGADINMLDKCGRAPIHYAAIQGQLNTAEFLFNKGADINAKDTLDQDTPLHLAVCNRNSFDVVVFLVNNGANVNAENEMGYTPLTNAIAYGKNLDIVQFLVDNGTNVNVLDWSTEDLNIMEFLISRGADVNDVNAIGYQPLFIAVWDENLLLVQFLLERGADVNAVWGGETPLHSAASRGNLGIVKLLVNAGADLWALDQQGETPLAVGQKYAQVASYLEGRMRDMIDGEFHVAFEGLSIIS